MSDIPKENPLQFLKGIGPKRAAVLHRYGIRTLNDLLNFFPRKYVDRSNIVELNQLQPDQVVTVIGKVEAVGIRHGRRPYLYVVISDQHGVLEAIWFNGINFFKERFKVGDWVSFSGKVQFFRGFQMTHPEFDKLDQGDMENVLHTGKILAFYPGNEAFKRVGLNSYTFRKAFFNLFKENKVTVSEHLPAQIIQKRQLPDRFKAYQQVHLPDDTRLLEKALYRFKYEEFFNLQLMLALQRAHLKEKPVGISFTHKSKRLEKLYYALPFKMTEAQKRVVREIRKDMKAPTPMNRLLQGDVGAGKTLVAVMAMLIAIDNGYQAALMVPTEILAEQHYFNIKRLLKGFDVKINLLTGSTNSRARKEILSALSTGEPQILIGTHALIYARDPIPNLGLIVIDEQHRFGVMQRARLIEKGQQPDVLVMTATPIPRTLALTAYGNLDVSTIDELPPNRQPITTLWRFENATPKIYQFLREHLDASEQAYIIYPLVEESEKMD